MINTLEVESVYFIASNFALKCQVKYQQGKLHDFYLQG